MSCFHSIGRIVARKQLLHLFVLVVSLLLIFQVSTISLTMSNPSCSEAVSSNGACSIDISSLAVSGGDPSFSRIEVLIDGKLRVYMAGFFESTAYLNPPMLPGGLSVKCGRPNSGVSPDYGKSYLLTVNAYMADGTSASDSQNVFCPAFEATIYMPVVHK
jgi:hypothetical protein